MAVIIGSPDRLYTFAVRVPWCDDVEELDIAARTDAEALKKAEAEAADLYGDCTLVMYQDDSMLS